MKTKTLLVAALAALAPLAGFADLKETSRLVACRKVIEDMIALPEGVPRDLLDKSACVIIVPGVKKAALGAGGRLGWGAALCRTARGEGVWGAPLMVSLKGGSFGLQIGGESSDLVLLVMDTKGIDHLLSTKFTLGADASIAAGPLGRSAEADTDASMHAEILSYSQSRGIFAGLSIEGASLAQDKKGNDLVYLSRVSARQLLLEPYRDVPASAAELSDALQRISPRRRSH
jgi:lipid-binding SYLF domain-containing protein